MSSSSILHPGRRRFLKQSAMGAGGGLLFGLISWDDVYARAERFGIVPGTVVDAHGRATAALPGSEPFIGELLVAGFTFAPKNHLFCQGQLILIQQNTALFSLLGTTFGGNGQTTFALPDLRGRMPRGIGQGPGLSDVVLGETGGVETVTLTEGHMPAHTHPSAGVGTGRRTRTPSATALPASVAAGQPYGPTADGPSMPVGAVGGGQAVSNMPPFLALNFSIAIAGLFPPRP